MYGGLVTSLVKNEVKKTSNLSGKYINWYVLYFLLVNSFLLVISFPLPFCKGVFIAANKWQLFSLFFLSFQVYKWSIRIIS